MLATLSRNLLVALLLTGILWPEPTAADVLVVCPDQLTTAIEPWIDYRRNQGYKVVRIASQSSASKLQEKIRKYASEHPLEAILLVGDAQMSGEGGISTEAHHKNYVPTHYHKAKIITPYAGDKIIATDNPFGDLDGDHVAEIPVGRLPVDRPEDLARLVKRIIAYEANSDFSSWRRQINLVAGVGGFGPLIDSMIEGSTKTFLISKIPPAYQTSMTQANWQSPYCPDPRQFRKTVLHRLNEGCMFWIYLGHGHVDKLDRLQVPGGAYPILEYGDATSLHAVTGAPIALLFCCYAAAFDAPTDCLAEEMLRSKAGPIAVLGGSRTTMPYAMTALGNALMDEYFKKRRATLGEVLMHAKRKMADKDADNGNRIWMDRFASLLGNTASQREAERHEHIHLFNLLGDPLLKLTPPQLVPVMAPRIVEQGEAVSIEIDTPLAGIATVELIVRRGTLITQPMGRKQLDFSSAQLDKFQEEYWRANNQQLDRQQRPILTGLQTFTLQLPPDFTGPCHARIYIEGVEGFALGAADIYVDRRTPPVRSAKKVLEIDRGEAKAKETDFSNRRKRVGKSSY